MWRSRRCASSHFFSPAAESFQEVHWRPAVDVYRTRVGWLVKFDLAGVRPEDVRLEVQGRSLTIQGERRDWIIEEGGYYESMEISYSSFARRMEFPTDLEKALVTTEYQMGLLLVRIQTGEERP
jgi:HSP20 family protein